MLATNASSSPRSTSACARSMAHHSPGGTASVPPVYTPPMRLPLLLIMVIVAGLSAAQYPPDTIVDESRVPAYTLPDPLKMESGDPVRDAAMWREQRRPELLRLFETHVYGRTPADRAEMAVDEPEVERGVLGGAATRKQVTLRFRRNGRELPVDLLIYLPAKAT